MTTKDAASVKAIYPHWRDEVLEALSRCKDKAAADAHFDLASHWRDVMLEFKRAVPSHTDAPPADPREPGEASEAELPTGGMAAACLELAAQELPKASEALSRYFEHYGAEHLDDCPEDDTCDCPLVLGVNGAENRIRIVLQAIEAWQSGRPAGVAEGERPATDPPWLRERIRREVESARCCDAVDRMDDLAEATAELSRLRAERDEYAEAYAALVHGDPLPDGKYPHTLTCNADHRQPIGCDMCSCHVGRPIKKLRAAESQLTALRERLERAEGALAELEKLATVRERHKIWSALKEIASAEQKWVSGVGSYAGGETNAGFARRLQGIARAALADKGAA
jgi:hypothetical protein